MDVYEFFKEYARMFRKYHKGVVMENMCITVEGIDSITKELLLDSISTTKDSIDKIIQWSKDNPRKTRLQDFLEKYPNAATFESGTPKVCASALGYCEHCMIGYDGDRDCDACWNEPIE